MTLVACLKQLVKKVCTLPNEDISESIIDSQFYLKIEPYMRVFVSSGGSQNPIFLSAKLEP